MSTESGIPPVNPGPDVKKIKEATPQKRSVGLGLIIIRLDGKDYVVLQRRGKIKEVGSLGPVPESYAGALQNIIHGKLLVDETPEQALVRKVKDESGTVFYDELVKRGHWNTVVLIEELDTDKEHVWNYAFHVGQDIGVLNHVRLPFFSGGLIFLSREELPKLRPLRRDEKDTGVVSIHDYAAFQDEIDAIKKAFEKFAPAQ